MSTDEAGTAAARHAELAAARLLLSRMSLSPADLLAAPEDTPPMPTFAEYIAQVRASVGPGTRRVYGSYWNRILDRWAQRRLDEITASGRGDGAAVARVEAVLDEVLLPLFAPWAGPVVDEWKASLSPVEDMAAALRLRRVVDLLGEPTDRPADPEGIETIYRDPHGRYVVVHAAQSDSHEPLFHAEWPVSLDAVASWTDRTVIAADNEHGPTGLFPLTPTDDGGMRVDPIPLPRRNRGDASFAYGYTGGTPHTTYNAIARCALGPAHLADLLLRIEHRSQLWEAISTAKGPLRLPWSQARRWAEIDRHQLPH